MAKKNKLCWQQHRNRKKRPNEEERKSIGFHMKSKRVALILCMNGPQKKVKISHQRELRQNRKKKDSCQTWILAEIEEERGKARQETEWVHNIWENSNVKSQTTMLILHFIYLENWSSTFFFPHIQHTLGRPSPIFAFNTFVFTVQCQKVSKTKTFFL